MQYERPRNDFPLLLNEWGLLGTGVEVGTCRGVFARTILDYWPGHLHCVDPWAKVEGYEEDYDHEANYRETLERLREFEGRFTIHRKTSLEAARAFKDGSLDFVYLDANHRAQAVSDDLEAWAPKVRTGGMLAGDDYGIVEEQWVDFGHGKVRFGVKRAVDAWAHAHKRNISINILADWMNSIPGQGEIQARGWYCIK
jgi:hypothetical protein